MKKRINCKKVAIESLYNVHFISFPKTKLDMKTRYECLAKHNSKLN